jgi:hypothetical protein
VEIEDLHGTCAIPSAAEPDIRKEASSPLPTSDGQIDVAILLDRVAAQRGIPISSLPQHHILTLCNVRIPQRVSQFSGKVQFLGPWRPFINLLQEHHVRIIVSKDLDDPIQPETPIHPDPSVDVVCHHP